MSAASQIIFRLEGGFQPFSKSARTWAVAPNAQAQAPAALFFKAFKRARPPDPFGAASPVGW